jgi:hypothetical protein
MFAKINEGKFVLFCMIPEWLVYSGARIGSASAECMEPSFSKLIMHFLLIETETKADDVAPHPFGVDQTADDPLAVLHNAEGI